MSRSTAIEVNRTDVFAVQTPPPTKTWRPIPHNYLLELIERDVTEAGMEITGEHHLLDKDGARWFCTLQVQHAVATIKTATPDDVAATLGSSLHDATAAQVQEAIATTEVVKHRGYSTVIGARNSHDKAFVANMACGSHVMVCDNLCFWGEIVVGRMHTSRILHNLPRLIKEALSQVLVMEKVQDERIGTYRDTRLLNFGAHDALIRAVDANVIPASKIPTVLGLWRGSYKAQGDDDPVAWGDAHEDTFKPNTVWRLFNAFTSVLKLANQFDLPAKSRSLHALCDDLCGYETSNVGGFVN